LRVSVIVPTHDRPRHLQRCVEALLCQRRLPDELIVVHDGPGEIPPQIGQLVNACGLRFIHEQRDSPSLTASRNRGVQVASGQIIVMVDDDVVLPPDALARLVGMYEVDQAHAVQGIGLGLIEPDTGAPRRRLWEFLAFLLGRSCWRPRRCAARYVRLPAALRGQLRPARRFSGSAFSLRGKLARSQQFCEELTGYAYGEDREFSFRVGQSAALFLAEGIEARHEVASTGRPDMHAAGRLYVKNSLHIAARAVEAGAGTALLVGYDFAGMILLHTIWSLLGRKRRALDFAAGMIAELLDQARRVGGNILCG